MKRSWFLLSPAALLLLSGCELPNMFDKPDSVTIVDPDTVYVQGLSFARVAGFEGIEATDFANSVKANTAAHTYAAPLGMDEATFMQTMAAFDLYLIDSKAKRAYPDNISVSSADGAMPDDEQFTSQLAADGAKRVQVDHVETDIGEVTTATFTLRVGRRTAYGEAILVDHHGPVVITCSSSRAKGAARLADQVLDTLDESASPYAD